MAKQIAENSAEYQGLQLLAAAGGWSVPGAGETVEITLGDTTETVEIVAAD